MASTNTLLKAIMKLLDDPSAVTGKKVTPDIEDLIGKRQSTQALSGEAQDATMDALKRDQSPVGPGPEPFNTPTAIESPHSYTGQPHDPSVFDIEFKADKDAGFETLDDLVNRVADKGERAVKRAKTQELDLEGREFEKGVKRVEEIRQKEMIEDPLFPNPEHPRSRTSRAIKHESNLTEINHEIQDIEKIFKKQSDSVGMFDIEKLKKAPLNPTPALKRAAAAGDRKAIEKIEVIKINSRLWKAWSKFSTNAAGARKGDPEALERVRAIGRWLTKGVGEERTPLANLEGPRREIPANVILQDILEGL